MKPATPISSKVWHEVKSAAGGSLLKETGNVWNQYWYKAWGYIDADITNAIWVPLIRSVSEDIDIPDYWGDYYV